MFVDIYKFYHKIWSLQSLIRQVNCIMLDTIFIFSQFCIYKYDEQCKFTYNWNILFWW